MRLYPRPYLHVSHLIIKMVRRSWSFDPYFHPRDIFVDREETIGGSVPPKPLSWRWSSVISSRSSSIARTLSALCYRACEIYAPSVCDNADLDAVLSTRTVPRVHEVSLRVLFRAPSGGTAPADFGRPPALASPRRVFTSTPWHRGSVAPRGGSSPPRCGRGNPRGHGVDSVRHGVRPCAAWKFPETASSSHSGGGLGWGGTVSSGYGSGGCRSLRPVFLVCAGRHRTDRNRRVVAVSRRQSPPPPELLGSPTVPRRIGLARGA